MESEIVEIKVTVKIDYTKGKRDLTIDFVKEAILNVSGMGENRRFKVKKVRYLRYQKEGKSCSLDR